LENYQRNPIGAFAKTGTPLMMNVKLFPTNRFPEHFERAQPDPSPFFSDHLFSDEDTRAIFVQRMIAKPFGHQSAGLATVKSRLKWFEPAQFDCLFRGDYFVTYIFDNHHCIAVIAETTSTCAVSAACAFVTSFCRCADLKRAPNPMLEKYWLPDATGYKTWSPVPAKLVWALRVYGEVFSP
jgi:hypothetical protein